MTIPATIETKEDLKVAILHQLGTGEANAIHKVALAKRLGLSSDRDQRQMRLAIVEMRHNGMPILSSQKGYYLASDINEITQAREYLRKYIISLCIDLRDLKHLEHKYTGQISMRF